MYDLVVVGAGPYGLSIAAHAAAAGLDLRVFGRPMAAWRDHMPPGMYLKSEPWASNLSAPRGEFDLAAYAASQGTESRHGVPLPVRFFASYGLWFAERAVPPVDERLITAVRPCPGGFHLTTDDGQSVLTRTVALALGVMPFIDIPAPLRGLPPEQVSHSSHHADLARFEGQDVTVVGGGQAALETAALLAEQGTAVGVVVRADRLNWNTLPPPRERPVVEAARRPHTGLGCGWRNWLYAETPGIFRRLPAQTRARVFSSALGPAGAWWLRDRFEPAVGVRLGESVAAAVPSGGRVRLELVSTDGRSETVETDHVIAATGFTPGLDRLGLLDGDLRGALRTVGASQGPEASAVFESSYPGLFLAGLLSAPSFGPSMRFVYGATYTAERLVAGVRRRLGTGGGLPVTVRQRDVRRGAQSRTRQPARTPLGSPGLS
ncbi:NAD(P)-binding domain-containing protein [Streptomyces sp. AcH 505]|uniref:NAD(P)-binding domain-containing protein n=1 Tax=Streptomyces sp. AcH 505 TaxID=352211 RepID=UPI0005A6B18E